MFSNSSTALVSNDNKCMFFYPAMCYEHMQCSTENYYKNILAVNKFYHMHRQEGKQPLQIDMPKRPNVYSPMHDLLAFVIIIITGAPNGMFFHLIVIKQRYISYQTNIVQVVLNPKTNDHSMTSKGTHCLMLLFSDVDSNDPGSITLSH